MLAPVFAEVPPGVTDKVVKIAPYVEAASPTLTTPVVVLVAVVGHTPLASPWMCWTWGYEQFSSIPTNVSEQVYASARVASWKLDHPSGCESRPGKCRRAR